MTPGQRLTQKPCSGGINTCMPVSNFASEILEFSRQRLVTMSKDCFPLHILGNPQFAWKREVCMLIGGLKLFLWLVVFLAAESNRSWHPTVAGLWANSRSCVEGTTEDAPAWMWKSILPAICSSVSSQRGPSCLRSTGSVDDDLFFSNKMRTGFVFGKANNLKEAAFTPLTGSKAVWLEETLWELTSPSDFCCPALLCSGYPGRGYTGGVSHLLALVWQCSTQTVLFAPLTEGARIFLRGRARSGCTSSAGEAAAASTGEGGSCSCST